MKHKWTEERRARFQRTMALKRQQNNTIRSAVMDTPTPITKLTFKGIIYQLKRKRTLLDAAISSLEEMIEEQDET